MLTSIAFVLFLKISCFAERLMYESYHNRSAPEKLKMRPQMRGRVMTVVNVFYYAALR